MKRYISSFLIFLLAQPLLAQHAGITEHECAIHKAGAAEAMNRHLRVSANRGADQYDIHYYQVELEVTKMSTTVAGNVLMRSRVIQVPMDTFWFELKANMQVDSVYINGQRRAGLIRSGDVVLVPLAAPIAIGGDVQAQIWYGGTPTSAGFFSGMTSGFSTAWSTNVTWTLSQPYSAPDWLPCKQDLWDKIDSLDFIGITNAPDKVGSLGLLQSVDSLPGNKRRYHWKHRYPVAFYLIAFAVTDYAEYITYAKPTIMNGDSILMQHWVYNATNSSNVAAVDFFRPNLDATNNMMEVFCNLYGLYPFHLEKYGHMQSAMGGGMEHQTMSTMGSFGQDITAHELIHMWFGDYVTCATWSDIWLNEGFASYGEYLFRQFGQSQANADAWMNNAHNSARQATSGSVYVPAGSTVSRIFSSNLTYRKAGAVAHMLRWQMGSDTAFFNALNAYLQAKAFDVSTTDEFRQELEAASGQQLTTFFNEWVYGEGFPTYTVNWNQLDSTVFLSVAQTTSSPVTPQFSTHIPVVLTLAGGATLELRVDPTQPINRFLVPQTVSNAQLDPANWLLKGTGSQIRRVTTLGVSVNDNALQQVKVFPNPASTYLEVSGMAENTTYVLRDVQGRAVATGEMTAEMHRLNLLGLTEGLYFLQLRQGNAVRNEKIVVRH